MAAKKDSVNCVTELDERIVKIIREEYSDFEKYLPTPQERAMYQRKQKEYWDRINARIKEELNDGRTADAGNV